MERGDRLPTPPARGRFTARVPGLAVLAAFALSGAPVWAHPHAFLDSSIELVADAGGITGFWMEWVFDPLFSAAVALDHDRDRDRQFSAAETEQVRVNAFDNVRNYGYFTWLTRGRRETRPDRVERFSVRYVGDRLAYRFFVPYPVPVGPGAVERIAISVYDETFYTDVRYSDPAALLDPAAGIRLAVRVESNTGRVVRYSTTDGNVATNLGTKDAARYTGTYRVPEIQIELRRPTR